MTVIEHTPRLWAILFSNGWQYTPSEKASKDAERQGLPVVEYVPSATTQGAVGRIDAIAEEMERAADLDEQDAERRVTRFDARQWAFALRAAVRGQSRETNAPKET